MIETHEQAGDFKEWYRAKDYNMIVVRPLPFGELWYTKPDDAVEYAKFRSRSPDAPVSI